MKTLRGISFVALLAALLQGCVGAIHEFPTKGGTGREVDMKVVRLYLDSRIEPYIVPLQGGTRADEDDYRMRFTIGVFYKGQLVEQRSVCATPREDRTYAVSETFCLQDNLYTLAVWAEYADGNDVCLCYGSEDITWICPKEPYRGNTEDKDAFSGVMPIDLREQYADEVIEMTLTRPFGKWRIVATDLEEFMLREGLDAAQVGGMTARLSYNGFFPYGFNALTDKPNNAITGVTFPATVAACTEGLELAFDYVWVNGTASSVNAKIELFDHNGNLFTTINNIDIPSSRGKLTTITGKFLTTTGNGGLSIETDYDGEYNIYIP